MTTGFGTPIVAIERFLKPFIFEKEEFDYGAQTSFRIKDEENKLYIIEIISMKDQMHRPYTFLIDFAQKLKKQLERKIDLAKNWEWTTE